MRVRRNALIASAAVVITLGIALPTSAYATPGGTSASVTIEGGSLSITVPVAAGNLGTVANAVNGEIVSGPLGQVQVNDARDAVAGSGWVASVIATAFTPVAGPAIPASDVSYTAGPITQVGTATYTPDNPNDLTGVSPAITATGITGDNSASWTPTISVAVRGGMAPGVYSATITHSVL